MLIETSNDLFFLIENEILTIYLRPSSIYRCRSPAGKATHVHSAFRKKENFFPIVVGHSWSDFSFRNENRLGFVRYIKLNFFHLIFSFQYIPTVKKDKFSPSHSHSHSHHSISRDEITCFSIGKKSQPIASLH